MLKTTISRLRSLNTFHSLSNISSNTLPASQQTRSAHTSRHKPDEVYDNNFIYNKDPDKPPRLFVVQPRLRPETALNAKLSEALNLANSLEEQRDGFFVGDMCDKESPSHVVVQNPGYGSSKRHSDTYFGPGTVKDIKCHLNVAEEKDEVDAVFVNSILSGIQQRNLEREWGKPVLDRVGLIIEIFNAHAQTKEGKLQSELAALMYKKTRLVRVKGPGGKLSFGASGEAEVVSARGRGSGGRGFISGAGETELQLQRRRILERRNQLLSEIEEVRRTRALQRASRRRRGGSQGQGLSTVAIVGYTNAGKSTLVNALSESGDLYSDDRLFATVDPRVRSVILPSGRKVLVSDTVGFISDLPVQLVDAFHATLEEVVEADLLVHVIDSSAVNLEDQRSSVLEVLQQIGVSEEKLQNMIEVWNKIDLRGHLDDANDSLNEAEFEESDFTETEDDMETDAPQEASIDEEEEGGFTETEDGMNSDSSLEESIDKGNSMPGENDNNVEVGENTSSEDWIAINYQQDSTENWKIVDDQQEQGASSELSKAADDKTNAVSHNQNHQRIKVSAVMGVGLQELLNAIDEKLEEQNVVKRSRIDGLGRKWRPPRNADTDIAIEH